MLRGGPVVLKHCWHLQSQRQAITDKRVRPTGVSPLRLFFLLAGASLSYDDQSGLKLGHPNCQGLGFTRRNHKDKRRKLVACKLQ